MSVSLTELKGHWKGMLADASSAAMAAMAAMSAICSSVLSRMGTLRKPQNLTSTQLSGFSKTGWLQLLGLRLSVGLDLRLLRLEMPEPIRRCSFFSLGGSFVLRLERLHSHLLRR